MDLGFVPRRQQIYHHNDNNSNNNNNTFFSFKISRSLPKGLVNLFPFGSMSHHFERLHNTFLPKSGGSVFCTGFIITAASKMNQTVQFPLPLTFLPGQEKSSQTKRCKTTFNQKSWKFCYLWYLAVNEILEFWWLLMIIDYEVGCIELHDIWI